MAAAGTIDRAGPTHLQSSRPKSISRNEAISLLINDRVSNDVSHNHGETDRVQDAQSAVSNCHGPWYSVGENVVPIKGREHARHPIGETITA